MATQSNPKVTDYDFKTGKIIERDATEAEIASWAESMAWQETQGLTNDEAKPSLA
jgi:hypothetical protein